MPSRDTLALGLRGSGRVVGVAEGDDVAGDAATGRPDDRLDRGRRRRPRPCRAGGCRSARTRSISIAADSDTRSAAALAGAVERRADAVATRQPAGQRKDRRRLPNRRPRSEGGRMEPCGFGPSRNATDALIQPRDGNRLRKRTSRTATPGRTGRPGPWRQSRRMTDLRTADALAAARSAASAASALAAHPRRGRRSAAALRPADTPSPSPPSAAGPAADRRRPGRRAARRPPIDRAARSTTRSRSRSSRSAASSRRRRSSREIIDASQLRTMLDRASSTRTTRRSYVARQERLYKALGLLPAGRRPATTLLPRPAHGSQVAGFYDPTTKTLYVVVAVGRALGRPRQDHVRPRVHPRAPGPALRPSVADHGARSSTRATGARPRWRSSRATRRCS